MTIQSTRETWHFASGDGLNGTYLLATAETFSAKGHLARRSDGRRFSIQVLSDGTAILTVHAPGCWTVQHRVVRPSLRAAKNAARNL
jgi:hypothetical protein